MNLSSYTQSLPRLSRRAWNAPRRLVMTCAPSRNPCDASKRRRRAKLKLCRRWRGSAAVRVIFSNAKFAPDDFPGTLPPPRTRHAMARFLTRRPSSDLQLFVPSNGLLSCVPIMLQFASLTDPIDPMALMSRTLSHGQPIGFLVRPSRFVLSH